MNHLEQPAPRGYFELLALAHQEGIGEVATFALAWLAAGRMLMAKTANARTSLQALSEPDTWKALITDGLPPEAVDVAVPQRSATRFSDLNLRARATKIVLNLYDDLGNQPWDIHTCITSRAAGRSDREGTLVPQAAAFALDLLGHPEGQELWIPFDPRGQLTVEALRRGWHVLAASPLSNQPLAATLLLIVETGLPVHPKVRYEFDRDSSGQPTARADYSLVMPPFGVQIKGSRFAHWDTSAKRGTEQFSRSETWAIDEFVNRTDKRAVFVVPQGLLFIKGQEQRLREYLLRRGGERNEVEQVIALPAGAFNIAAVAASILVIAPGTGSEKTRMSDLNSGRRSMVEANDVIAAGREQHDTAAATDKSILVDRETIAANEYSLAPSRYLRRVNDLGDASALLAEVCLAIRPPTTVKEPTAHRLLEIGLPELTEWRPIDRTTEKYVQLKAAPREGIVVLPGDVILSIKGTIGKAAIAGKAVLSQQAVVSQSCLALRSRSDKLLPEFLLLYLRSPHGQAQLEALQVGAGVQHISPSTLLSSFKIPIPPLIEQHKACEDYKTLCRLETELANLRSEMNDLTRQRWPSDPQ